MIGTLEEDYSKGIYLVKKDGSISDAPCDLTLERIRLRLLDDSVLVQDLQGHGQLFGMDEKGRILFKDRGTAAPSFWVDSKGKEITMTYDSKIDQRYRDRPLFSNNAWYGQVYEGVCGSEEKPTGYELLPKDEELIGMIAAVEKQTKTSFIGNFDRPYWQDYCATSWVNNGRLTDPCYVDYQGASRLVSGSLIFRDSKTVIGAGEFIGALGINANRAFRLLRLQM